MEQKQPIGLLFDSIAYYTPKDVDNLCDDMNLEQSYYMLIKALEFSHRSGVFSLQESEVVSKSLRVMNRHLTNNEEE
jgi:hypothetical protein